MQDETSISTRRDIGLDIIAGVHVLAAILPAAAIACLYYPGDEIKNLPWALLTIALLASAWGLRRRSTWAPGLTLIIHWPAFLGTLWLCLYMLLFSRGIEIGHFYGGPHRTVGLFHLLPVLLVSGGTLWKLQWRFAGKPQAHHIIAAILVHTAILLAIATVQLYNPGDQIEALPWALLSALLLAAARGMWRQAAWARVLTLIIVWPAFVGSVIFLPLCLVILLLVPARGIAVGHVYAMFGLIGLPPILLVSGYTLWYLHKQRDR